MSTPADSSPYRDSSTRRFVANSLTRRFEASLPSFGFKLHPVRYNGNTDGLDSRRS